MVHITVTSNKQRSIITAKTTKSLFYMKYNSFINHRLAVTLSKRNEIGLGQTNFELLTSYFLNIFLKKLQLIISHFLHW